MGPISPRPPLRVVGSGQAIATPRERPYLAVTWVSKIMGGEARCLWSAWFRGHNTDYQGDDEGKDWSEWVADHNEMVHREAEFLRRQGYAVSVESLNNLKLEGQTGIVVSGTPDLIAVKDGFVRVEDCKTGQARVSHRYQLMIYMAMLPLVRPDLADHVLEGHLVYGDGLHKEIPVEDLDDIFKRDLWAVVRTVGGDETPPRAPSANECAYCPIAPNLCSDRVTDVDPVRVDHDLF